MCPCRPPSSLNVAICWHKGRQFSGCRLLPLSSHGRYKVIRASIFFVFFNPPPRPTPFSSSRSVSLVFQESEAESCHEAAVISMCKGLRCWTRGGGGVKGEKIPGSEEGLLHSALLISQAQAPPGSQPAPSLLSLSPSLFPGWRPRAADHPRRPNIGRVGPESRVQRASSRQHTGQNIQGRWRRVLEETRALQRGSRRLGRPTTRFMLPPQRSGVGRREHSGRSAR